MTGAIVLVLLTVVVAAALEFGNRRTSGPATGLAGSSDVEDRDIARIKSDLLAQRGRRPSSESSVAAGRWSRHGDPTIPASTTATRAA